MSCVLDSNDIRGGGGYFDELYAIESSVYEFCHLSQQGSTDFISLRKKILFGSEVYLASLYSLPTY